MHQGEIVTDTIKDIKWPLLLPVSELVAAHFFTFVYYTLSDNINGKMNTIKTRWQRQYNPWQYSLFSNIFISVNHAEDKLRRTQVFSSFCLYLIYGAYGFNALIYENFVLPIGTENIFLFSFFPKTSGLYRSSYKYLSLANHHQEQTISLIWLLVLQI